jgi:hypothetical protein
MDANAMPWKLSRSGTGSNTAKSHMNETASLQSRELFDSRFWWCVFFVAICLAALSFGIAVYGRHFAQSLAMGDFSDSAALRRIELGNHTLLVPENVIRFENQRSDGPHERLDLFLKWPEMSGYVAAFRNSFTATTANSSLIFLSFTEQTMSRDMSGRFEPIYRSLIVEPGAPGPAGLTIYQFRKETGYRGESLVTGVNGDERIFVARCLQRTDLLTACERDVLIGDELSLTYRFPSEILDQWRAIDTAVTAYARGLIKSGHLN